MKLLITGGCGFLGSNVAARFLADGNEVVVIDALFRSGSDSNADWLRGQAGPGQVTIHDLDAAERESGPFAYVCHFAGQVAMTTALADPHRDFLKNAMGTLGMPDARGNRSRFPGPESRCGTFCTRTISWAFIGRRMSGATR